MVPVSNGESIFTAFAMVTQESAGIHFRFFLCPHIVHRMPVVIRISQWLSTGLCTPHPQIIHSFPGGYVRLALSRRRSVNHPYPTCHPAGGPGAAPGRMAGAGFTGVRCAGAAAHPGVPGPLGGMLPSGAAWQSAGRRPPAPHLAVIFSGLRPAATHRTRTFQECAGKYNCPLLRDDLPWIHDDMADAETSRVHEPGLAA